MIDLYIEYQPEGGLGKKELPFLGLPFYEKYRNREQVTANDTLYLYRNAFTDTELADSFHETPNATLICYGKVYYRNPVSPGTEALRVPLAELVPLILNQDLTRKVKGNFVLVYVDKLSKELQIINSPFGVRPFHYSLNGSRVILSSNATLMINSLEKVTVNCTALVQVSLFDTLLGNNTLVEQISQTQYGEWLRIKEGRVSRTQYYNYPGLFAQPPRKRKDTIDELAEILRQNNRLWELDQPYLLGLTGGYDCRLNLSSLTPDERSHAIAYTYGMLSSPEIAIARKIAGKMGMRHEIVPLETDYEQEYLDIATEALLISDGFAPFMRCNYLYAHRSLSPYAKSCITGMYGSEFIKPMHVMADSVSINSRTVQAFLSGRVVDSIRDYFTDLKNSPNTFYKPEVFTRQALEETLDTIQTLYLSQNQSMSREVALYHFYMHEGMRKFFMEILRIDRFFVDHKLPFLDQDFIEALLASEYAGVYNNIFNESLLKRRKGQMFYVDALARLNPALNHIPTDRGYKPVYMKSALGWTLVGASYVITKKLKRALGGNPTYNTKKWRSMVYKANLELLRKDSPYFRSNFAERIEAGEHLKDEHVFGKHFSVLKWMDLLENRFK